MKPGKSVKNRDFSYPSDLKYRLYEETVQNAHWQVDYLPQFHSWLVGRAPRSFREDFSGSGKIACEWVKRGKKNRAVGLDLDPEAIDYAKRVNQAGLPEDARKRVDFLKQDVLKPTREKFDMIGAFNFSYFVFHERKELLKYFKSALKSLNRKGTLFLEVGGGVDFFETLTDEKRVKVPGVGTVRQIWEQHVFDPITAVCDYSIHFELPGREILNDAFTYHWRLWGIRDLREALLDAGFTKTVVLWEQIDEHGEGTGEYLPSEECDYARSWVAYVVGVKG